ncbi:MAG TPA: isoprenylcysteine carboxylmethyltransferase family protein [Bryobacteraceae bacterium]|nr:isoprenylcysteine carboxylmethyltransferase family protein [Bryobacteraceae bacterium]
MSDSWFPKPYADTVARLRVICGFLLVATFAWLSRPSRSSLAGGLAIAVLGLWLRGWAAGHLQKNMKLAESGPYSWVRNPLYLGTSLVAAGLVIAARRWELALIFGAVFLLVYLPVIELEEQHLRKLFPEYADYARRVHKLLPVPPRVKSEGSFRWSVYRRNEEYQAALGLLAGAAWLIYRLWNQSGG